MTIEQHYEKLDLLAQEKYEQMEKHIIELPSPKYLQFVEQTANRCEFKIGSRRILVIYSINLRELRVEFLSYEIKMSYSNFGAFTLSELDLKFVAHYDEMFFSTEKQMPSAFPRSGITVADKRILRFPNEYFNQIERCFVSI